ncbi:hypothetical protein QJS10_CPB19g01086 [Acorus calamus]|uniref:Uncharacterized protein n=1 Tax=Acorus calamus TaxID=4465 RepID=A0AAV9CG55_ACOCL|nr:hypothetical protein QJS10_CPB19g01086 [Acorus calamus]
MGGTPFDQDPLPRRIFETLTNHLNPLATSGFLHRLPQKPILRHHQILLDRLSCGLPTYGGGMDCMIMSGGIVVARWLW